MDTELRTLYLITARGGSKGIPGKNIKPFMGKPLVCHSIDHARAAGAADCDIMLSTDSPDIRKVAEDYGLAVPYKRPVSLGSDTTSSYDVILDAVQWQHARGRFYDLVVLLQPTSPLRTAEDIENAMRLWRPGIDMVVSVREARSNPYYGTFEADARGMLHISKGDGRYTRRQDAPKVWEYNGAVYVISIPSLLRQRMSDFRYIVPSEMPACRSVDLDTPLDWEIAERLAAKG